MRNIRWKHRFVDIIVLKGVQRTIMTHWIWRRVVGKVYRRTQTILTIQTLAPSKTCSECASNISTLVKYTLQNIKHDTECVSSRLHRNHSIHKTQTLKIPIHFFTALHMYITINIYSVQSPPIFLSLSLSCSLSLSLSSTHTHTLPSC